MPPKSKANTSTQNTSATATPVASADVLAKAAAPAAAEAIASQPAEGATSAGEAQVVPPLGGIVEGAVVGTLTEEDSPVMTHEIKAIEARGFCRAGMRWFQEGTFVNRDDWSDEQWAALIGEPKLVVRAL